MHGDVAAQPSARRWSAEQKRRWLEQGSAIAGFEQQYVTLH